MPVTSPLPGVYVLEGYVSPRVVKKSAGKKGKKTMSKASRKSKFKSAAKACKGKKIRAFRACMRAKLKK